MSDRLGFTGAAGDTATITVMDTGQRVTFAVHMDKPIVAGQESAVEAVVDLMMRGVGQRGWRAAMEPIHAD